MTNKSQCLSLLEDCLALQLHRVGPPHQDTHYWMYDSGYLLFQGFLEANLKCRWDVSLTTAMRDLSYRGYVCPGVLLVAGGQPALHLIRSAWSRRVLKPPPNYTIALLGDMEDCTVSKVRQTGFTPLPDAVCWVILQLSSSGKNAVLDSIQDSIASTFPDIQQPTKHLLYDTLAELTSDNKVYQTAQGYFLASPEKQREGSRQVLLTHAEAAAMVSGEIVTIREGARTHQGIQTNLADVICGGNKSDKVLYARAPPKSGGRKLERRHSMRLLGSSRRLSSLHRAGSVRLLHHNTSLPDHNQKKSSSLFSKLFKWPKRQTASPAGVTTSISMQFPPQEWFNSTVLGLNSVGTQTKTLRLCEKRRSAGRQESLELMSPEEIVEEKGAMQKALLQLEASFGRPQSREEKVLVRSLYDRYRAVKRMLLRHAPSKLKESVTELGTILEHETMDFTSSPSSTGPSQLAESPAGVEPSRTPEPVLDNLHSLPVHELLELQRKIREEKKKLRRNLREYEQEFQIKTGRKLQKEDRNPLDATYIDYKNVKAKLRFLDALIAKTK